MTPSNWFRETYDTYFANAAATRDFRAQFRGAKVPLLFGVYLVVLIGTALYFYTDLTSRAGSDVTAAQRLLSDFQRFIMITLGVLVSVVAPALSATAVVIERGRQSLDLVFSAPVKPRYYLVGKLLAAFRITWTLLALSLPITAMTVVLGGATWTDILIQYGLLSVQGLTMTAIAVLISTIAKKPVDAITWAYIAVGTYLFGTAGLGLWRDGSGSMPLFVGMNPFLTVDALSSFTRFSGIAVPNWIVGGVASLLIVRLCLMAAGSVLSPSDRGLARRLRLDLALALAGFVGYGATLVTSQAHLRDDAYANSPDLLAMSQVYGVALGWILMPLALVLPLLACYSVKGERRYQPNGRFRVRDLLNPSPATALPYLGVLLGSASVAAILGAAVQGVTVQYPFAIHVVYLGALWAFFWSIARLASALVSDLRTARLLTFVGSLAVVGFPSIVSVLFGIQFTEWQKGILAPLLPNYYLNNSATPVALALALPLVVAALIVTHVSEVVRERRTAGDRAAEMVPADVVNLAAVQIDTLEESPARVTA